MSYMQLIASLEEEATEVVDAPVENENANAEPATAEGEDATPAVVEETVVAPTAEEAAAEEVAVAEDTLQELDEINQSVEAMAEDANAPAYARKLVADRLKHINARTGLPLNQAALEAFHEGKPAELQADLERKQNKLRTFIAKRKAK